MLIIVLTGQPYNNPKEGEAHFKLWLCQCQEFVLASILVAILYNLLEDAMCRLIVELCLLGGETWIAMVANFEAF